MEIITQKEVIDLVNEVKIFENSEFGAIRTVTDRTNSVWFCGSDVAKALGYERGAKAVADVVTYYNGGCGFVEAIETALERLGGEQ